MARKYRQVFTSFRNSSLSATHCTLSAALVLQGAKNSSNIEGGKRHDNGLDRCIQVLDELSTSWSPAQKICRNLKKLRGPQSLPERDIPDFQSFHQSTSISPPSKNAEHDTYTAIVLTENEDSNKEFGYSEFPGWDFTEEMPLGPEFDSFPDLILEEFGSGLDFGNNLTVDGFGSHDLTFEALPNDYRGGDSLSRWQHINAP